MAGQGGSISVNQQPQYGDKTILDNMSKATTKLPGSEAVTPTKGPGRPATGEQSSAVQPAQAIQEPPGELGVPNEHTSMMQELAQAYRTKVFWENVLKNYPSEWSRLYAADAAENYRAIAAQLRSSTPYFE